MTKKCKKTGTRNTAEQDRDIYRRLRLTIKKSNVVPSKFVNFVHVKVLIYIKTENSLPMPSPLTKFSFRFTNNVC